MSSRKRRLVTPQHPDEKRRTDRIVVDVVGTRFTTSASTLTAGSEYFERLLSPRWCAEPPEERRQQLHGPTSDGSFSAV